ncbi:RICIN domain-containing protein [Glycomyces arizonensis]|uniref:RICIN domain-containing protein n=1 Tax=Glycomyces arizonensis TaxID=256035 RepID=UPI0004204C48|nr:RICIN domain-containing protein [Glycomyces arizonensis]
MLAILVLPRLDQPRWNLNPDGTVTSAQSGRCPDVEEAAIANGTPVILWGCNGGDNQQWVHG